MIDNSFTVRSYVVSPGVRGAPRLVIRTDKDQKHFTGAGLIRSFITAAEEGCPFRAEIVSRETPSGGSYEIFIRKDD